MYNFIRHCRYCLTSVDFLRSQFNRRSFLWSHVISRYDSVWRCVCSIWVRIPDFENRTCLNSFRQCLLGGYVSPKRAVAADFWWTNNHSHSKHMFNVKCSGHRIFISVITDILCYVGMLIHTKLKKEAKQFDLFVDNISCVKKIIFITYSILFCTKDFSTSTFPTCLLECWGILPSIPFREL